MGEHENNMHIKNKKSQPCTGNFKLQSVQFLIYAGHTA